jgi:hypothetical protein
MASSKKGTPRGTKKEQAEESNKNTIVWIQLKNGMGMQNKEIAEMFNVSEVTVSRNINAFYKKMQSAFGPEYQEIVNEMVSRSKQSQQVSTQTNTNNKVATNNDASFAPGSLTTLTPSENILATIGMDQATKMAYAAGVVPAQAIELVARGLKEDGRSREERGNDFIKGGSLLFGLAFGLLEGYKAMNVKNETKTINNGDEI